MLGAILGDMIGSPYEGKEQNIRTTDFPLFTDKSIFTDDTVMTAAVADALMDSYGREDDIVLNTLSMGMRAMGRSYPGRYYGDQFQAWIIVDDAPAYGSFGNGSAMRVSAAGWLYRTLGETLHAAELTALPTHNHPEGIRGAQAIAAAIFLARAKCEKQDIRNYLMRKFGYDLTKSVKEYRSHPVYSTSCEATVPIALTAFFEGTGFVDIIRKAVSVGGDSDTIAAMAGSIAEAYYGIPANLEEEAFNRLDDRIRRIIGKFHRFYYENSGTPLNGWQDEVYYNPDAELNALKPLAESLTSFYEHKAVDPEPVFTELVKLLDSESEVLVSVRQPSADLSREKRTGGAEIQCIQDNDGRILMPIFTSQRALGKQDTYVMTIPLSGLFQTLQASGTVSGIIINPYGDNFVITKDVADYLQTRLESLEDEREKEAIRSATGQSNTADGPVIKRVARPEKKAEDAEDSDA